ncbi:unnamed protein product [Amoebophrya sp. A25]|nr:unnamed protein product [Amoebophrya sp. A25]|eukprot:GSA25T00001964001.1
MTLVRCMKLVVVVDKKLVCVLGISTRRIIRLTDWRCARIFRLIDGSFFIFPSFAGSTIFLDGGGC